MKSILKKQYKILKILSKSKCNVLRLVRYNVNIINTKSNIVLFVLGNLTIYFFYKKNLEDESKKVKQIIKIFPLARK